MHEYYQDAVDEWLENRKILRCGRCKLIKLPQEIDDSLCFDCRAEEEGTIERTTKHGDL